jgi:hypothetical protein
VQDTALREKLRKIEALFAGAATPGERDAAEAAMLRVRARLAEIQRSEQPVEMQFSIQDQWAQRLFVALCRRYGLRPYRRPRQKRSTIMVRLPRAFSDQILWPEFLQLNEVLQAHLLDITLKLIRDHLAKGGAALIATHIDLGFAATVQDLTPFRAKPTPEVWL